MGAPLRGEDTKHGFALRALRGRFSLKDELGFPTCWTGQRESFHHTPFGGFRQQEGHPGPMAGAVWFLMITAVYRHSALQTRGLGTHRSRNPGSYHLLSSRAKLYDRVNDKVVGF